MFLKLFLLVQLTRASIVDHSDSSLVCQQRAVPTRNHSEFSAIESISISIQRSSVCDGISDCHNSIDEQCIDKNPLIHCSTDEFLCPLTHRCIPNDWLCNGFNDCRDPFSSDELNCSKRIDCQENEFHCRTNGQCIPFEAQCDGISDCADESDESSTICQTRRSCKNEEFSCQSNQLCIPQSSRCDTISQCHDRSDEMFCRCPSIDDYLIKKYFFSCDFTGQCWPKDVECESKQRCEIHPIDDYLQCPSTDRSCSANLTCQNPNEFCQQIDSNRCVCHFGFRFNQISGRCDDIDECRERAVCDHFCINTVGSYRCACRENYHLKPDKHTCVRRFPASSDQTVSFIAATLNGIEQFSLKNFQRIRSLISGNGTFLIDFDPIDQQVYFGQCSQTIRSATFVCSSNVHGIFRISLENPTEKHLFIADRDLPTIESFAIDWIHRNFYLIDRNSQTIHVCHLNGKFCRKLFHQPFVSQILHSLILFPEKGFLFYISIAQARTQHVFRLGLDGENLKLLFTWNNDDRSFLRPLLTIDPVNDFLYFYNGLDRIWMFDINGEIRHVQYQLDDRFDAFAIFDGEIFKSFFDENELRIHSKYAVVENLLTKVEENPSDFDLFHQVLSSRYRMKVLDFRIVDSQQTKKIDRRCDACDQLCFPNSFNQNEIVCACADHNFLDKDRVSCRFSCPQEFFSCSTSKRCVSFNQRCDGFVDCTFGEDEDDCQSDPCENHSTIQCVRNQTTMDSPAISASITCEMANLFRCQKVELCINQTYVCDGHMDCADGSDEHSCQDETPVILLSQDPTCIFGYRCNDHRYFNTDHRPLCIPLSQVCDGIFQCPFGDDEHPRLCRNCTDCTSFGNQSNSVRHCPDDALICHRSLEMRKTSSTRCECDSGYEIKNVSNACVLVETSEMFEVMLHPGGTFYINQSKSIVAPIDSSHHPIDVAFIPMNSTWSIIYAEHRSGHSYVHYQPFYLNGSLVSKSNEIWTSSSFRIKELEVDWIHRFIYILYDDLSSALNGIEILYATTSDYASLKSIHHLSFSNLKTISSIKVHPFQGYLYISAYYDAEHSFIYRSYLDGSNLELFQTVSHPIVSMALNYRTQYLNVLLSDGRIDRLTLETDRPCVKTIYRSSKDLQPYSISFNDDQLIVMVFNRTDSMYDLIEIDQWGTTIAREHRRMTSPMFVHSIHRYTYPTTETSKLFHDLCAKFSCPSNEICIVSPAKKPLCIVPMGRSSPLEMCRSACYHRGICSKNGCACLNETYAGDDCSLCVLDHRLHVGCFDGNSNRQRQCLCYLTRSSLRQTPYRCISLTMSSEEIEVPCDRMISPIAEKRCSKEIFGEPWCDGLRYSLIFHRSTQTCICRETKRAKSFCENHGLLIMSDSSNSTVCSCPKYFAGPYCQKRSRYDRRSFILIPVIFLLLSILCYALCKSPFKSFLSYHRINERPTNADGSWLDSSTAYENDLFLLDMLNEDRDFSS